MTNREAEELIRKHQKQNADDILGAVSIAILIIVLAHL